MGEKVDAFAGCPYYKYHEKQKIHCEGPEKGTAIHLAFSTIPQLNDYKIRHCRGCWKTCRIAEMLNRKWNYEA